MDKQKKWPKVVFGVGMVALAAGLTFLIVKLVNSGPAIQDADFLVEAGEWVREDQPAVIWDFTEVGKGLLTTDGRQNNYPFVWALENGTLKIETNWLYNLNDEFTCTLDQGAKTLTIKNDEAGEIKFKVEGS